MKKRIALILLSAAFLLGAGCSSMLERSYVSATAHVDYYSVPEDPSILRADSYQGLVNSILYFVETHAVTGTIRLYNYTGDVEADLASACTEILNEDPLGAYAVRDIRYDTTRIVTYYEINLSVIYSRSAQEVEAIQYVTGLTGLRRELGSAIDVLQSQLTMRISYFSWSEQYLEELFWIAYYSRPLYAQLGVEPVFTLYPDSGVQRIIELSVQWPMPREDMLARARQLEETVAILLEGYPSAGEKYTPAELAQLLKSLAVYSLDGSQDPADALAGAPVDDMGLLLALELLCQEADLDATMVLGTIGQQRYFWLIVESGAGYRHILPQDLVHLVEGDAEELVLYTDEMLTQLGFVWQTSLYPVCDE